MDIRDIRDIRDIQYTRDSYNRQQVNTNKDSLVYPYTYIDDYDLTPRAMIGEMTEDSIDFPSCVTHYYWIHEGVNDEVPWRSLFRYVYKDKTGYGFYIGKCDYTGFDCCVGSSMRLYVSDNMYVLIQKALTDQDYSLYIKETEIE